ncbi:MAG: hypothetical protein JJ863_25360 [Deltaproteobacteria bacterium]|nr:hypothetical protein [Deltaproteobacteria bacterium]
MSRSLRARGTAAPSMSRLLFLLLLAGTTGCLSANTYQTAQVMERGDWELGLALYGSKVRDACFAEECATYTTPNGESPLPGAGSGGPELVFRVGVGHRMDFGARVGVVGARVDLKAQLVDTEYFDLALDLGVRASVREIGVTLPLILSSQFHEWFGVFASAQGMLSRWRFNGDGRDTLLGSGVAGSFGVSIGPPDVVSVRPEVSYHHVLHGSRLPDGLTEPSFGFWSFGVAVVVREF